ncbi:MAG: hypothetical protein PHR35_19455, partial [Kiritimatiellae bacterium]|nr:hypothetical protein [Kiritimatiellia bacterium]
AARALRALGGDLKLLRQSCAQHGYELIVFGDYAIEAVSGPPIFPNRRLREAGLLATRAIGRRRYLDPYASRALVVTDHQIAHVYVRCPQDVGPVRDLLRALPGVGAVLDASAQAEAGIAHANGGELLLTATPGRWFAYPWWTAAREAPDYAGHVDIHNKPGYDPCELLPGWPPWRISQDASRIRGTHGLTEGAGPACWAATCFRPEPAGLLDLARRARDYMDRMP